MNTQDLLSRESGIFEISKTEAQRESLVSKELPMSRLELQITLAKLQDATAKLDQLTKQWDDAMAMYDKQ